MLEIAQIDQIVGKAVGSVLHGVRVSRVCSEEKADWDGQEALRVLIVFETDEDAETIVESGLDMLVRIQDDLMASGEDRFAYVEIATVDELLHDDDPES